MPSIQFAQISNWQSTSIGFDAIGASSSGEIIALADGANSCPGAGTAARWLTQQWVIESDQQIDQLSDLQQRLERNHACMRAYFPETACTLAFSRITDTGILLGSVGDSFIYAFHRSVWPWGHWTLASTLPRDVDAYGNPTQLVGSDVLEQIHVLPLPARGKYLIVLMSDGAGAFLSSAELLKRLRIIGNQIPGADDLSYLCDSCAKQAHDRGSKDDISIALAWCQFDI